MISTIFLFIWLINSFGIDQQILAYSQRGNSVLLMAFFIGTPINSRKGTLTICPKLSITLK